MNYTWVLQNFYAGLVLGAIARVIPRARIMIENPIYRNGAHGIAPWRSYSAPSQILGILTTNDLVSGKRIHHV
jgi:hypothetical protein